MKLRGLPFRYLPYVVALGVCFGLLWKMYVGLQYDDCLIKHRSGVLILAPRDAVKEACRQRLNPFF